MTSNYKCTFDLKENKGTSVTQKQMPSPREQYRSTIHLFIGADAAHVKLQSCPLHLLMTLIHRGLNNLFPFKSVPFSAIMPKLPCI
jgi:hypothetical protein